MIVCAAIKFQIVNTKRDAVLCGLRHGDIFSQMADLGLRPNEDYIELCQGFIDNKGEFLDRHAALAHALNCGQIPVVAKEAKRGAGVTELFSEDLY